MKRSQRSRDDEGERLPLVFGRAERTEAAGVLAAGGSQTVAEVKSGDISTTTRRSVSGCVAARMRFARGELSGVFADNRERAERVFFFFGIGEGRADSGHATTRL